MSGRRLSTRGGRRRAAAGGGRRAASCERDGTGRKHDAVAACAKARTGRAIANGSWHARRTAPKRTALRQPVAPNRIRRDGRDGKPRTASKRRADGLLPSPSMLHKQSDSVIEQSGPFPQNSGIWATVAHTTRLFARLHPTDRFARFSSKRHGTRGWGQFMGRTQREGAGRSSGREQREGMGDSPGQAQREDGKGRAGFSGWRLLGLVFGRHGG